MSRTLVYQANGVQGAAVVRHLERTGHQIRALIRDGSKAAGFLARGIEVAVADLRDRAALCRAHEGIDHVILQIPARDDAFAEVAIGNAVAAMRETSVLGVIVKMANPTPTMHAANTGFSVNSIIAGEVRRSGIPHSVIEPTMYLDTLLKPSLRREIAEEDRIDLPVDADLPIAWTTTDDAAKLAVLLLERRSFGLQLRCAGVDAWAGPGLAAACSTVLGRRITYRSTSMARFQSDIEAAIGTQAAAPAIAKFRFLSEFQQEARRMLGGTFIADVPGFRPTSLQAWIEQNSAQLCASPGRAS
jgi:uncharacterized protein YbjT (DUF2867 family)